jgi:CHAT domain-containing protein
MGGLDYAALPKKGPAWGPLPGAAREADRVRSAYQAGFEDSPSRRLQGDKVGRREFLEALAGRRGGWRYVHLGTHGFFEPGRGTDLARLSRNPLLQTGLVLSGANANGADGLVTAEEVAALDLRGCELAVLSACQTGAGQVAGWQGVQGLQRAFHQAGARHVAASLWSVNDAATSALMQEFYARLWAAKGALPPLKALQEAQLAILRDPQRVRKEGYALHAELAKRGFDDALLTERGILSKAVAARDVKPLPARGYVSWWAAWVISGVPGD